MASNDLTRHEALELITPVVDNEVEEELKAAFFEFIENDDDVREKYRSEKRMKEIVATRCPCAKAPDRLRKRVSEFLADPDRQNIGNPGGSEPIYDRPSDVSGAADPADSDTLQAFSGSRTLRRYAAAAAVLFAAILAGYLLSPFYPGDTFNVEEHVYTHFIKHRGQMVQPTIATASMGVAESRLAEVFNRTITVPSLKDAEFVGVVLSDFIPDFRTPMLEYRVPSENQYIYIFAFDVNDLERFSKLARSEEAVKSCQKSKDFHIRDVNGKHVVSWKWDDTWYTAISNHDGRTLASLVEPLQYEME